MMNSSPELLSVVTATCPLVAELRQRPERADDPIRQRLDIRRADRPVVSTAASAHAHCAAHSRTPASPRCRWSKCHSSNAQPSFSSWTTPAHHVVDLLGGWATEHLLHRGPDAFLATLTRIWAGPSPGISTTRQEGEPGPSRQLRG
jgi:hypothetical protein